MKAIITDTALLASVRPVELMGYVRTHGWRQTESTSHATVWEHEDGSELLIPLDNTFADYARRVADALSALSRVEQRSQGDVYRDLVTAASDVIRVCAIGPDYADGSMPLDAAVGLVERSRELMLAAACATHDPRAAFHARKPAEATEYMQKLRMGQTEVGSFVVTLRAPVAPALQPSLPGVDAADPFERRVTRTLMRSLATAAEASRLSAASGSFEPFKEAVRDGVSANLCDAIAGFYGPGRAERIAVSARWAATRPAPAELSAPVILSRDLGPILQEASRIFREQQPDPDVEVTGQIVQLNRDEGALLGHATVMTQLRGHWVRVRITDLAHRDYELVTTAHAQKVPVRLSGEVHKEATRWVLRGARGIVLADVEPDTGPA